MNECIYTCETTKLFSLAIKYKILDYIMNNLKILKDMNTIQKMFITKIITLVKKRTELSKSATKSLNKHNKNYKFSSCSEEP